MNYVAHLFLTYSDEDISLGNLLGDMISNKDLSSLSEATQWGVKIHRAIDHHTDNHPSMREVVGLLRPNHRKYAPVVADILLDHVMVLNWKTYSDIEFEEFEDWVYRLVDGNIGAAPERLHKRLRSMVKHRWLSQYSSRFGLQHVLDRMDTRAQFHSDFGSALHDFDMHYLPMQKALMILIRDLLKIVKDMQLEFNLRSAMKS